MKWASAIAELDTDQNSWSAILTACCKQIRDGLEQESPDLLFCFVSPEFADDYQDISDCLRRSLNPGTLIGCSASGFIGGNQEIEHQAAIALTAASLPDVDIRTFHLDDEDLPDLDAGPDHWEKIVGHKNKSDSTSFILLSDPFSFRIDILVQGLDFAFPQATKLGGLASGGHSAGINALFLKEKIYRSGLVGVALSGNIQVDTIVAQGCRPIGRPLRITQCEENFLIELDNKPAVEALYEIMQTLSPKEQKLVQDSLFLGVAMNEFKDTPTAGDFLIRNILGLERNSGALLVGEPLLNERTVQFHVRDGNTSAEDLKSLFVNYTKKQPDTAHGALLFSCLGRGEHLYGLPNHDINCFRSYLGAVPIGGFFSNGEIGQVAGTTFLHGYTSSFGIFRPLKTAQGE
ncbi:MAG: FIST C-terminal domain-containing protein [Candidatus Obscuribacterales bacterium]|nr:FIST C-terminal domain-containing protein [Candidatus Obscuribacterales bacterium]